jgi:cytochrome c oxidase accessory protein FixG
MSKPEATASKPRKISTRDVSTPAGAINLYAQREKIQVRSVKGFFQNIRVATIWATMAVFLALPWFTWNGRQALLFNLPARHFYILGWTFQPQDFIFLSWLLIIAAFSLFTLTVFAGRVYCGYVCPQTVWTKIFIWIEKITEGERNARIRLDKSSITVTKALRRGLKHLGWFLVALATGVTFIGYFTPVRQLYPDLVHFNLGFWQMFWALFFTTTTYINAGWMREQVCMYMCPYGRFQSVMLDKDTLIISYDAKRGEARGARKHKVDPKTLGLGDCIDCELCVQVCPTGIDIRDGLQFQCIQCAACIDACDGVMDQMGYARGLVRYTSENALEQGKPLHFLRPRLLGYGAIIVVMACLFLFTLALRIPLTIEAIHDRHYLYRESNEGTVENSYVIKIMNESQKVSSYTLGLDGDAAISIEPATTTSITLKPGEMTNVPVTLEADAGKLSQTHYNIHFQVTEVGNPATTRTVANRFLAPRPGQ